MMSSLSGNGILEASRALANCAREAHLASLRAKYPELADWTEEKIESFCKDSDSYSQSRRNRAGTELEKFVERELTKAGVPFKRQVPIDKDGIIQRSKKGMKVIDIVFEDPEPGDHISDYAVMSLKTSTRERASEDDWTLVHTPILYLFASLSADYPDPEKFQESENRKLVCAVPRSNDTRLYKLNFEDIIHEIRSL